MTNYENIISAKYWLAVKLLEIGTKGICVVCEEDCFKHPMYSKFFDRTVKGNCLDGIRRWLDAEVEIK